MSMNINNMWAEVEVDNIGFKVYKDDVLAEIQCKPNEAISNIDTVVGHYKANCEFTETWRLIDGPIVIKRPDCQLCAELYEDPRVSIAVFGDGTILLKTAQGTVLPCMSVSEFDKMNVELYMSDKEYPVQAVESSWRVKKLRGRHGNRYCRYEYTVKI